jgi:DNA polymerase III subunit epsilon
MMSPLPDGVVQRYPHNYALVDVETTGLNPRSDRVLQVAVAHLGPNGVMQRSWSSLLNPGCDPGPVEIHGLTKRHLADAPTYREVAPELARLLDGRILVAHNATFDWHFLAGEAERAGEPLPVRRRLCTVALTRHLDLPVPRLSLASVAFYFGVTQAKAHDAIDDMRVLAEIVRNLLAAAERVALPLPLVPCDPAVNERVYPTRVRRAPCKWMYPGKWTPGRPLVQGMKVSITGDTTAHRDQLAAQAGKAGLEFINSVSSRTSLLVCNDPSSTSGKKRNAAKHGVPVVKETEFTELLVNVAAGTAKTDAPTPAPTPTVPRADDRPAVQRPRAAGPLAGRCFLVLGGRHADAAEVRAKIGALGGIAAVNLTARVTDVVALARADMETRWSKVRALDLPICDPATFERAPALPEAPSALVADTRPVTSAGTAEAAVSRPAAALVLPRGGVVDLPDDRRSWSISVSWPTRRDDEPCDDVDVVAFLTDEDEQVRADADFVFYNAPAAADGSIELTLDIPHETLIDVRLDRIPDDVHRIILAATVGHDRTFADVGPVEIVARTEDGTDHIRATLDAATTERSLLLASIYRRGGKWRFRSIGQGYEYGLAELATNHGVDIED